MIAQILLYIAIYTVACAAPLHASPVSVATSEPELRAQPSDLKSIAATLYDLEKKLSAISRASTEAGLGARIIESKKALDRVESSYKEQDWKSVIRESSIFLSLNQKPDTLTMLRVYYIQGQAYEATKQYLKSSQAYARYLAILATNPDVSSPETTDVFERLIALSTKYNGRKSPELSRFLSTVATIEQPANRKIQSKYLSGVAGAAVGQTGFAVRWLGQLNNQENPPEIRARAGYFRALLAIHEKNWNRAAEELSGIIKIAEIPDRLRDNAYLSLARVQIKQNKMGLALQSYSQIRETSEAYRDAGYERIFLMINKDQNQEAKTEAQKWLTQNSNHPDAIKIKSLISWLHLKIGDLENAKKSLDEAQERLSAIQKSLKNDFAVTSTKRTDTDRLANLIFGEVSAPRELTDLIASFSRVDEIKQRLLEIDGTERNIIYRISDSQLATVKPSVSNQISQYEDLANIVFSIGLKMIQLERNRLQSTISALDLYHLEKNARERLSIFGHYEDLRRQSSRWQKWLVPAEQLQRLAQQWERINILQARKNSTVADPVTDDEVEKLTKSTTTARNDMIQTLRKIKENQIKNLARQSDAHDLLLVIQDFTSSINQDFLILSRYEPENGGPLERLDNDDARESRRAWLNTAARLHSNLRNLRDSATEELIELVSQLEKIDATKSTMMSELEDLSQSIEQYSNTIMPKIVADIDYAINQRIGRQLKWAGDLEVLKYIDTSNDQDRSKKKHALELQMLSDGMQDYDQKERP